MNTLNRYVLVGDHCETCIYTANAFTLMRLPLTKMSITDIITNEDNFLCAACFIICKHIEAEQGSLIFQKLKSSQAHIISFLPNHKLDNLPIHCLNTSFSLNDLQTLLAKSNDVMIDNSIVTTHSHPMLDKLIGQSHAICKIRAMIKQVAHSDSTVLILGQSGTGKDIISSCIHYFSNRNKNAFVPINCGAIPSELIESELFGHEKGAFTGAITRRPGRFEIANDGTLFLDEIGDMPLPMQVKLLRVIQDRTIERVGGNTSIKVNVRLIAATNKNLDELIKKGKFREDLFYRLNVFPIKVPSLSERNEDIPHLIDFHLNRIYERLKHKVEFTDRAKDILCHYPWPGNIRELENFLERMVILHRDQVLDEKDIDDTYKQKKTMNISNQPDFTINTSFNIKEYIANVERQMIQFALDRSNGIVNVAAEYLSLGRSALIDKMKKYNL